MSALGTALRGIVVLAVLGALSGATWWLFADDRAALAQHLGSATLPELVTGLAAVVLQGCLAWLTLLSVLVLLEPWSGRDLTSYAGCPAALRRVLLGICGIAVAGVIATPGAALAAPDPGPGPAPGTVAVPGVGAPADVTGLRPSDERGDHGGRVAAAVLDGLPLPERTDGVVRRPPVTASGRVVVVVVGRGDSLWSIAAALLPPDTAPAAIDHAWREVYAANRASIGSDPSLIRPGTRLDVPANIDEENR